MSKFKVKDCILPIGEEAIASGWTKQFLASHVYVVKVDKRNSRYTLNYKFIHTYDDGRVEEMNNPFDFDFVDGNFIKVNERTASVLYG